jgi:hypothetical protein
MSWSQNKSVEISLERRIIYGVIAILSALLLPHVFAIIFSVYFAYKTDFFWEFVLVGIIIDSLLGLPINFFGIIYFYTLLSILLLVIVWFIKSRLMVNV